MFVGIFYRSCVGECDWCMCFMPGFTGEDGCDFSFVEDCRDKDGLSTSLVQSSNVRMNVSHVSLSKTADCSTFCKQTSHNIHMYVSNNIKDNNCLIIAGLFSYQLTDYSC